MNNYNSPFSMLPVGSFGGTLSSPFSSSPKYEGFLQSIKDRLNLNPPASPQSGKTFAGLPIEEIYKKIPPAQQRKKPIEWHNFPTAQDSSQLPSFFGGLSTFGTGVTPMAASLSSPIGGGAPSAGSVFPPIMSKESPSFDAVGGGDGSSPMSSFSAELAYLKESIDRLKSIPNKTISQEMALNDAEKIYAEKATEMATLSSGKPIFRPMVARNTRLA